jgi:hypothetical protein
LSIRLPCCLNFSFQPLSQIWSVIPIPWIVTFWTDLMMWTAVCWYFLETYGPAFLICFRFPRSVLFSLHFLAYHYYKSGIYTYHQVLKILTTNSLGFSSLTFVKYFMNVFFSFNTFKTIYLWFTSLKLNYEKNDNFQMTWHTISQLSISSPVRTTSWKALP